MKNSKRGYTCSYIYKLILKDQSTYIGLRHCNCLPEEDPYLGSGTHYRKEDVIKKEILITGNFDDQTLGFLETVAIMDDKASNPKNKNVCLGAYAYNQFCLSRYNNDVRKKMSEKAKARWQRKDQREYLESCRKKQMTKERRDKIRKTVLKTTHTKEWHEAHSEAIKEALKNAKRPSNRFYIVDNFGHIFDSRREAAKFYNCSIGSIDVVLKEGYCKKLPNIELKKRFQ